MWLVYNQRNTRLLGLFRESVVLPILHLLSRALNGGPNLHDEILESQRTRAISQQVVKILRSTHQKHRVEERLAQSLASHIDFAQVYREQRSALENCGPGSVKKHILPVEIHWLFEDVFFGKCFKDRKLWQHIGESGFSKQNFIKNFRQDNAGLTVCPYCDIDTCAAVGNSSLDHFLPKKDFPLLAMEPLNLIPICSSCNLPQTGKGVKLDMLASSPYQRQIGDVIFFEGFDDPHKDIEINAPAGDVTANAYLKLLGLRRRYADASAAIRARVESLLILATGQAPASDELADYLNLASRTDGMYFVRRSILKDYSAYINATIDIKCKARASSGTPGTQGFL